MIITLKGADFSSSNIGTLSSWTVSRVLGTGATYSGATSVDKGASFSATVTIGDGYELGSAGVTVTMGGVTQSSAYSISGSTITISISSVTGNVVIKVPTKNTSTGSEDSGGSGSDEVTTVTWGDIECKVVSSLENMSFTIGASIAGGGGWNTSVGRAASKGYLLSVSGGETVTLNQPISGVTLAYSLCAITSSLANASTDNAFIAKAWNSTTLTLPSTTAYLAIAFKRGDGSSNFSSSEAELLKTALTIA